MSELVELINQLNDKKKIIFNPNIKYFYKHDVLPDEIWINKEIMIQLNITPKCPLSCSFCYIKYRYNKDLSFEKILKLFENLEKYHKELGLIYRINLTGGDIFYYYKIEELLKFLNSIDFVVAVDLLINRIWNNRCRELIEIVIDKVSYVQLNVFVAKEEDFEFIKKHNKFALLKYPVHKRREKKLLDKIIEFMKKYDNTLLSFDWIIPQTREYAKNCYLKDIREGIEEVKKILKILEENNLLDRVFTTSCIIEREVFNRIYLCGIGIQNIYVMPDEKISICSRYPFLETGYNIDNFDLIDYLSKYQKLISNTCLFENKYFNDFWKEYEDPKNW